MRFPLGRTQQRFPKWDFRLEHGWIVWKLLADPSGQRIVIEERNPSSFQARLRSIDASSGATLWQRESPMDAWWTNLTAVSHNRAILEGYASRDLPIAKGVAAMDIQTGETAWLDLEGQLLQVGRYALKLRSLNYGIERVAWRSIADGSDAEADTTTASSDAVYPHDLQEHETARLFDAAPKLGASTVVAPIEGATVGEYDIYAFHSENARDPSDLMQKTFSCQLYVIRRGRLVLKETLAPASPFPVAGNFIVLHDILIYVQEKSRLVAVHLT